MITINGFCCGKGVIVKIVVVWMFLFFTPDQITLMPQRRESVYSEKLSYVTSKWCVIRTILFQFWVVSIHFCLYTIDSNRKLQTTTCMGFIQLQQLHSVN